jgi:hypothetical protein
MAKEAMICPFSKNLCRECAFYRGRHYYLCYNTKYRGYLLSKNLKPDNNSSSKNIFIINETQK